jgi:tetratricopeptide (TPR) repeat protein
VLAGDGGGSLPAVGPFAVHDCFLCGLPAGEIAHAIAQHGLPAARERSDHGEPLARAHYREELARCEQALGPHHFAVARCHVALARNHDRALGGEREALAHYRAAARLYPTTPAPDHPAWFELSAGLGYRLKGDAGGRAEARTCYAQLRWLYERALGPAHLLVADCWRLLGDLSLQLAEPAPDPVPDADAARDAYERELAIWRAAPDDAIDAYRDPHGGGELPAPVAATTYALYPLDRDPDAGEDYREHQLLVAGARLAAALDRLGADDIPARVFGELTVDRALRIGDLLLQAGETVAAAPRFYAAAAWLGEATGDPRLPSIRAKLEMARTLADARRR